MFLGGSGLAADLDMMGEEDMEDDKEDAEDFEIKSSDDIILVGCTEEVRHTSHDHTTHEYL